ncbi:methyltransferase [Candidatus Woesearchaeota archaeon]|nr:methyltransferase [Candidatus Woesearchaeota archaeon]
MKTKQLSKSQLAISLSRLAVFENPNLMKEQYATDSEAAAEAMWFAYMQGDISGKTIADLGCGTGLLGIAALILGAEKVYFVDNDSGALAIARKNIAAATNDAAAAKAVLMNEDVKSFSKNVNTVIQNPPFGTKEKHADREFLLQAFKLATAVYSIHKIETASFVKKLSSDKGFTVTHILPLQLQLKNTYEFHRSRMRRVNVGCFRMEKS